MKDYLIDTHCHIQLIDDKTNDHTSLLWQKNQQISLDSVIASADSVSVKQMVAVGCNLHDSNLAIELANKKNNIFAAVGIHPHEATLFKSHYSSNQNTFEELIQKDKVKAIGECGLDYFYNHSKKEDQMDVFEFQLKMADKYNLPVIFHVRQAFDDFWPILAKYPNVRGVLHSYTDSMENLDKAVLRGFFIGVNGIATFTKEDSQLMVYKSIPLKNLLLETDSPYLTPVQLRGSINEPRNVRIITKFVASLLDVREEEIINQTTLNAINLFNL